MKVMSWLPIAVGIVGLLVFGFAEHAKVLQIGLYMFGAGLVAFLVGGVPKQPTV